MIAITYGQGGADSEAPNGGVTEVRSTEGWVATSSQDVASRLAEVAQMDPGPHDPPTDRRVKAAGSGSGVVYLDLFDRRPDETDDTGRFTRAIAVIAADPSLRVLQLEATDYTVGS